MSGHHTLISERFDLALPADLLRASQGESWEAVTFRNQNWLLRIKRVFIRISNGTANDKDIGQCSCKWGNRKQNKS